MLFPALSLLHLSSPARVSVALGPIWCSSGGLLLVALPTMSLYFITVYVLFYVRHHVYSPFIYLAYIASSGFVYIVLGSNYNASSGSYTSYYHCHWTSYGLCDVNCPFLEPSVAFLVLKLKPSFSPLRTFSRFVLSTTFIDHCKATAPGWKSRSISGVPPVGSFSTDTTRRSRLETARTVETRKPPDTSQIWLGLTRISSKIS